MDILFLKANSKEIIAGKSIQKMISEFPVFMQKRALRYRFKADAADYITGRLLLKSALGKVQSMETLADLKFTTNGKPFLKSIHFNISHSANEVLLAVSLKGRLGIDIEKIKPIVLSDFQSFFTNKEWIDISNHQNPIHRFYWYWTRKESIIKALGISLKDLHLVEINPTNDFFNHKEKKWFLQNLKLEDGFVGAICTEYEWNVEVSKERE